MSLDNFIPKIWSARILKNLRKAHVLAQVANTDYEGEISEFGDTVKINSIGPVTVRSYQKGQDLERDELDSAQTVLTIDQAEYFNFSVDDIDTVQQRPKVMDEAMEEAAHALSDKSDSHLAKFAKQASHIETAGGTQSGDVYELITEVNRKMDENNVPQGNRWGVVTPWFKQKMILAKLFEQQGSFNADDVESEGYLGRTLGIDFLVSNNLETDGDESYMPFGTPRALSFAEQILSTEAYRPEDGFADAVKGLYVFGAKLIDPKAMITIKAEHSAE